MRFGIVVAVAAMGLVVGPESLAAGYDPLTSAPPPGYYAMQKVVYQNDGRPPDNHGYFVQLLHNLAAHEEATGGQVEIRVVDFGPGLLLLRMAKTDSDFARQIDALRAKGVRFLVCRNTLRAMKLSLGDLYKVGPSDVVPSGVAELARLQGQGFVYIHP